MWHFPAMQTYGSNRALFAALSVAAIAAAQLVACSSSDAKTSASDASAEAGNVDAGTVDNDATADAADTGTSPVDYDPNVYPAPHHAPMQVKNYGGRVLSAMKLVVITFTGDTRRDAIRAFDTSITSDPTWAASVGEYGVGVAASVTSAEFDDPFGAGTVDTVVTVTPWVQKMVDAGKLPVPDASTVYAIYFGKDTVIKTPRGTSCTNVISHHDSATFRVGDAGTVDAVMSYLSQCAGWDVFTSTSRELITIATNPFGGGWETNNMAWASNVYAGVAEHSNEAIEGAASFAAMASGLNSADGRT